MNMIIKWVPALAIVGLVAMHVTSPKTEARKAPKQSVQKGSSVGPAGETVAIVPGSVHDGDTLRVRKGNEVIKVRFCGIDAPELAQPLGKESRDYLKQLVGSGSVRMIAVEKDRYKRTVGELFLADGRSVNVEMVRAGMAYHYAKYSGNCGVKSAIGQAEDEAKSRRAGVWAGEYQKPWEFRRMKP
jgi:endonuclease YncB( thermonuclease family)